MTGSFTSRLVAVPIVAAGMALILQSPAYAYVGPGLGLSTIGTILAFLAAVFFAIVGFIWYPVKRMRRRRQEAKAAKMAESGETPAGAESPTE